MTCLLLTSFQTWLPHQKSNASDDLLAKFAGEEFPNTSLYLLRNLPVDTPRASIITIDRIETLKPQVVICAGMAESREQLTIESQAYCGQKCYQTTVNLEELIAQLNCTAISHEAGKFVCEGLYFNVLQHLQRRVLNCRAIFVHVPLLTEENLAEVFSDFRLLLEIMTNSKYYPDNRNDH